MKLSLEKYYHLKLLIFKNVNIETIVEDLKSRESINEVNKNSVTLSINKTKLNLIRIRIHILCRTYRSSKEENDLVELTWNKCD